MAAPKVAVKTGILDGVLGAGPAVQGLLLLMIVLSVVSWAIIFTKRKQLLAMQNANEKFVDAFWKSPSLEDMGKKAKDYTNSNVARVFLAAFQELERIAEKTLGSRSGDVGIDENTRLTGIDNLERTLRKASDAEIAKAESNLSFLATVGSTAPFIGLLGTVLGIMTSFQQIASSGSASLAVVAPGISEALFATAVGLFAALPAVAAYNYFVGRVRKIEMEVASFGSDFLNVAKRNFFRES
ncbi:MAG: protein TolQ [Bdellovibrionales bacterium]|jgi:biopolymer transport protein TolQ|nr:protein TolQ [Bdellovibrionales bacterium]